MARTIVHVDMDAFYASVEQRDRPELRGRPVIVGGDPRSRGVVSAASYEARRFGVRSAMPAAQAQRLCPQAIFLAPDFARYAAASAEIMAVLESVTPLVEPVSIDEAYLDLTGTERLLGDPVATALRLKQAIRDQVRLTASVGIGPSKLVAKLASEHGKPDGFVVVPEAEVRDFLDPLPIRALLGVGARTQERLERLGLSTVGALARCPREVLEGHFGQAAGGLVELAKGNDNRPVTPSAEPKSVSAETTFERDIGDLAELDRHLLALCDGVARRLRKAHHRARTVNLKLRFDDFKTITRSRSLPESVDAGSALYRVARELLMELSLSGRRVRLIGVGGSNLCADGTDDQLALFRDEGLEHERQVDRALDTIQERFGREVITRAGLLRRR